ncbi:MAG: D-sedoheptulose 7-phosphate isomerase [Solitalea-like symbiont of Acarus siro]
MDNIKHSFLEAQRILNEFASLEENFIKIRQAGDLIVKALKSNKKIISCGNGGSMCDAMHFAEELSGRFRINRAPLPAIAISDPSYLSCFANDYGYQYSFSRFIEAMGHPGDILIAISTSGNSANIIEAVKAAKKMQMWVVALTGKDGGQLASICDLELRSPASKFSDRVQEIHIKIIHTLVNYIEQCLFNN